MADENKAAPNPLAGKPSTEPEVKGSAVSDKVAGETSPGTTPSFGKRDGLDENTNLQNKQEAESIEEGSAASSGSVGSQALDMEALEARNLAGDERDDGAVQFTCPNIARLAIGHFEFQNGQLSLSPEDADKFREQLNTAPPQIQSQVFEVDRDAGEAAARRYLEKNGGRMVRGGETTASTPPAPVPGDQPHLV
jgi:hypothetical protein